MVMHHMTYCKHTLCSIFFKLCIVVHLIVLLLIKCILYGFLIILFYYNNSKLYRLIDSSGEVHFSLDLPPSVSSCDMMFEKLSELGKKNFPTNNHPPRGGGCDP